MHEITERIKIVIDYSRVVTFRQFAAEIGVNYATFYNQIVGKREVSLFVIQKILLRFPEIEERWLVLGEGNMWSRKSLAALNRSKQ